MLSQKNVKNKILPARTSRKKSTFSKAGTAADDRGVSAKLSERIRNDKALANRNYLSYLSFLLQKTQGYHLWHQYLDVFRKFRLLSLLFRIYSYLLVLLQLGTAFFVLVIGLMLLLPILIFGAAVVIFSALLLYRRKNKSMAHTLKDQNTVIFFPSRDGELIHGDFWRAHIEDLSSRQNTTVLIVSPHFWSGKGITGNQFYFLLRKEKENVYILRKHYFFSLRQEVLEKAPRSLAFVY